MSNGTRRGGTVVAWYPGYRQDSAQPPAGFLRSCRGRVGLAGMPENLV